MKEIGGYFGLECAGNEFLHKEGVFLNSGRNALRYIVRAYQIKNLFVPSFTCPVVWDAIRDEDCAIEFYNIGLDFMPQQTFPKDAYILYNNYFGVCGNNVQTLANEYQNLIVDNAQALYAQPCGLASFYSPRKFFGLPDGGIAICDKNIELPEERDVSINRVSYMLKRTDLDSATEGYTDFQKTNVSLRHIPILKMSRLTETLMGNLDVDFAKCRRLENMKFLKSAIPSVLTEQMAVDDVPLVYPFYTERASELRKTLIANKVYVATYWSGVESCFKLRDNILALPIDQRYSKEDMNRIIEIQKGAI